MKKWLATLIDDLKFLWAEFKREFSDLGSPPPVTAEQHQQRIAEMRRYTVAGKLSRGDFANQGRGTDLLWHENEMVGFRPEIRAGKPGKIAVSPAFWCQV
ncbi:TPA: hypothetical protein LNW29_004427 [Salmonella enterica subsp. enterica serovar Heidelberg]|nr:hypothetical protein [Salmonella enterica subsp. enterica serovar Heidelberg]